ncbi:MAG TPA: lytic transglycosylase domain-containing protein [bacterium]|nr:lytic transglycosylase domain-containing protein [bacterium]HQP99344.1 lytic transglycosylase domain-containing protein [bacterium]
MKSTVTWLFGWRARVITVLVIAFALGGAGTEISLHPDLLHLKDAGALEGHFISEDAREVVFFTLGGEVRLPRARVDRVDRSADGESELFLGRGFLDRKVLESAETWFQSASRYAKWKSGAEQGLAEIAEIRNQQEVEQRQLQEKRLATLIFEGDYDAGLRAIDKWSKQEKVQEEDQWAGHRAKIHFLLAKNAVDHLDYRRADYHLKRAQDAGMSDEEWRHLRAEVDRRRRTGYTDIAKEQPPAPAPVQAAKRLDIEKAIESVGLEVSASLLTLAEEHALQAGIDPLLVCAVIQAESAWNPKAQSPKGAQGLMQLMPVTAREMGVSDPLDPSENIKGGTGYLKGLLDLYGVENPASPGDESNLQLALGAYNAGPARIAQYNGLPPFEETRSYVQRVTRLYREMTVATTARKPS